MSANDVLNKLRLKSGHRAIVLNAPESYKDVLAAIPDDVALSPSLEGKFDFIHLFVSHKAEAEQKAPGLLEAMKPQTVLWISYPKGKAVRTDLNRDILWKAMEALGLRAVSQIAIDEVWSAMRFKVG